MSDPWSQFGEPTSAVSDFKSLDQAGDRFIGTVVSVESSKPFADSDPVPRINLKSDNGTEFHYDVTLTRIRNALLRLRPGPGTRLEFWRGDKSGRSVESGVNVLGPAGTPSPDPRPQPGSSPSAFPDDPPF